MSTRPAHWLIAPGVWATGPAPTAPGETTPRVWIWKWPKPVRVDSRFELPPIPTQPVERGTVYGPPAKDGARMLMREAKRAGVNIGPRTKRTLLGVIRGRRGLSYKQWRDVQDYVARVGAERQAAEDLRVRPMRIAVVAGQRPQLLRRGPSA